MATFRTNLPEVFEAREAELFFKEFEMDPLLYPMVFNITPSNKAYEDAFRVSALGTFRLKAEGAPVSYDDPVQGVRRRVVHSTFALGFRVTMEAQMDAQYDVIDRMPGDLADSARNHQENLAWGLFNDAFAGATHTGLDTLSLVNTAHTMLKPPTPGTTLSNEISPGVALSTTGLEAALTRMRTTQDEQGRQIGQTIRPKMLIVPPDLEHIAATLLQTDKIVDSTDNNINTVATSRTGVTDFVVPFLTDTDNWFLVADKRKHGITWYNRMELTTDNGRDTQTKDRLFDAMYRSSIAIREWRGVIGSQV
jgi:hypothetical protein